MKEIIDLSGCWSLTWEPGTGPETTFVPETGTNPEKPVECPGPIPAAVPGDVHNDMVRAGILPEPLFADNVRHHGWVENATFIYTRTFTVGSAAERAVLVFHAIDGDAEILLDGERIGRASNAFVHHEFDVSGKLRIGVEHTLTVRLSTGVSRAKAMVEPERYICDDSPERMFLRKPQFSFGWDWAPRLVTCGIWKGVELRLFDGPEILECLLRPRFTAGSDRVTLQGEFRIRSSAACDATLRFGVEDNSWTSVGLRLEAGETRTTLELNLFGIERWYPAGYGAQPLYRVSAELAAPDRRGDRYETTYGFREIEIDRSHAGRGTENFIVTVNGVRVFWKGANWVPADSLPGRVDERKTTRLLGLAREANLNSLRIWGGGVYESEFFYEECSRLGIMVWQDFMFACAEYPDDQEWFMDSVRDEAEKTIRRLRRHASLALWCGNNENDWIFGFYKRGKNGKRARFPGETIWCELLPELCARLDPDRPYWPSSPYGGEFPNEEETGDRHSWDVSIHADTRTGKTDFRRYRDERGRFISEYGLMSLAIPQTIREFSGLETIEFRAPEVRAHDNTFNRGLTEACVETYYGAVPEDPEERCWRSLTYQAEGYREAITAFRARKFECAGSVFWMYSDCWGTHGWTIVDYYLRKKPSFYSVKRACAPIMVFSRNTGPKTEVFIVNDTLTPTVLELEVEAAPLCDRGQNKRQYVRRRVEVEANGSVRAAVLYDSKGWVYAAVRKDGVTLSEDITTAYFPSELPFPETEVTATIREEPDGVTVELTSDGFAHAVRIETPDGAEVSDNYFNLVPGRPKRVLVTGCRARDISVRGMNVSEIRMNATKENEND